MNRKKKFIVKDSKDFIQQVIPQVRPDLAGKISQIQNVVIATFSTSQLKKMDGRVLEEAIFHLVKKYAPKKLLDTAFNNGAYARVLKVAVRTAKNYFLENDAEEAALMALGIILADRSRIEDLHARGELLSYIVSSVRNLCNEPAARKRPTSDGPTRPAHLKYENKYIQKNFIHEKTGDLIDMTEWLDRTIVYQEDSEEKTRLDHARDATNELAEVMAIRSFTQDEGEAYSMFKMTGSKKSAIETYHLDEKTLTRALDKVKRCRARFMTDYREFPDYKKGSPALPQTKSKNPEFSTEV